MEYSNPIISKFNADGSLNKMPVKQYQINPLNLSIQLEQIPSEYHRVLIDGMIEVYDLEDIKENNFKVNYGTSVVNFHPSKANQFVTVREYYGMGVELITAKRVATEISPEGDVVKTLQDDVDIVRGKVAEYDAIYDNYATETTNTINTALDNKIDEVETEMEGHRTTVNQLKTDYDNATHFTIITSQTGYFTATTSGVSVFQIPIGMFNPLIDLLTLSYCGEELKVNEHYSITGGEVALLDWTLDKDEDIYIKVFKGVKTVIPVGADGSQIMEKSITQPKLAEDVQQKISKVPQLESQLADISINVKKYMFLVTDWQNLNADWTPAIQAAINEASTTEYTETIPSVGAKSCVLIPAGKYKITSTLQVPSYVNIKGNGRNTTILESYITNGSPVVLVKNSIVAQQFYNNLEGFSVNGRGQNCQGVKFVKTSRWIMRDVMIDRTLCEGLYLDESYLGEIYSPLIRACGDSTHNSVVLTGPTQAQGSHAISFFGGEINGGGSSVNGVDLKIGASVSFFGTTIEGFSNGIGLINRTGVNLMVNGCYFEVNKEHIVETDMTYGSNYIGNYFAAIVNSGRGHIGLKFAKGAKIEGNYFQQTSVTHIFDITEDNTGRIQMSSVRQNMSMTFPVVISQSLIDSAKQTGTIIERFDGNFSNLVNGRQIYNDRQDFSSEVVANDKLTTRKGVYDIGNPNGVSNATYPAVFGGLTSPEGSVIAPVGSIYMRNDSSYPSIQLYVKQSGTGNTGWVVYQGLSRGSTRPTVNTQGFMHYDTTLKKPIWWDGTVWNDTMSRFVNVPTSATATGNIGDWSADINYLYACYSSNKWIRIAKDSSW